MGVSKFTVDDFEKGKRVKYVPQHAGGNPHHEDCETGVVSSKNDKFVFVKYDNAVGMMITGDEQPALSQEDGK